MDEIILVLERLQVTAAPQGLVLRKVRGGSQDHAAGTERPANISTVGSAVGTDVRPPEHEVEKMFTLKGSRLPAADVKNVIFFVRPKLELMDIIAKNVLRYLRDDVWSHQDHSCGVFLALGNTFACRCFRNEDRRGPTRDFHILFVPRRSLLCEQRLKDLGVLGSFIHRDQYSLDLIPFDGDLLSMESEGVFRVGGTKAGVVHFLGEMDFAKGERCGVELDEPLGKNDGAVAGTRYFQGQNKYDLVAPVHKVTKIGSPSTTPAKAKAAAVRRLLVSVPAGVKRSPSLSSLSSVSSVASSVSSKPSRTGLKEKFSEVSKAAASVQSSLQVMEIKFKGLGKREEQLVKAKTKLEAKIEDIVKMSGDHSSQLTLMNNELRKRDRCVEELQLQLMKANEQSSLLKDCIWGISMKAEETEMEMRRVYQEELKQMSKKMTNMEEQIVASRKQCQVLQAAHEQASAESKARHDEALQALRQQLLQAEERLHDAQVENGNLRQELAELKKQADKAQAAQTEEDALQAMERLSKEKTETLASLEDSRNTNEKLQSELNTLKKNNLKNIEELNKSKELLEAENQKTEQFRREIETLRQTAAQNSVQLSALLEEKEKLAEELGRSRDQVMNHQKLEEERSALNNQLLEMKKREAELIRDSDEERASLQKSISITSALLTEKDSELEKLRNEVTVLREESASSKTLHSVVQSLESDKVKLDLKVKNLELQLKENKRQLLSSAGNADIRADEDERAQENQIEFLNSVIVDLQKKNEDLKMKVEMMSEAALNGGTEDLNNYDSDDQDKQGRKKPRLFCDICDCFDLHDTEDCPTQAQMAEDPPHSTHHGKRSEERPYCDICEVFGHWPANCNDDETF